MSSRAIPFSLLGNGIQTPEDMLYLEEQALAGNLHSILAVYGEYDFVLFDSPTGIGVISREILAICNSFIQVIDCRAGSVKSMAKLLKLSSWIKRQSQPGALSGRGSGQSISAR